MGGKETRYSEYLALAADLNSEIGRALEGLETEEREAEIEPDAEEAPAK